MAFYKKIFFFLMLVSCCCAGAEAPADEKEAAKTDISAPSKDQNSKRTWEEFFIDENIAITHWVDSAADGLDMFLMGERLTETKNNTHLRLQNSTYGTDGQGIQNVNTLGVNLRLPNFEEYWLLKFSTYDENAEERGIQNGYLRQSPLPRNYGAGVGFYHKLGEVRVAFQPRLDLQNPLSVSHSLSFEEIADFDTYQINPRFELFATPQKGVGEYGSLNFNFILSRIYNLTFINYCEYDGLAMLFTVTNGFSVGQIVNQNTHVSYSLLFNSTNTPSYELSGYTFSAAWSQLIYRKILDYQLIPHLDYIAANSYQGTVGMTINFNFNF